MPPKKSSVLAALDSAFPPPASTKPRTPMSRKIVTSEDDVTEVPPSPAKKPRAKSKVYKSAPVIDTDDDEPLAVNAKSTMNIKNVPSVTVTKGKLKPGAPVPEVLELSDGSSVEEEENGNNSSVMDDELEGDDCEFEGDKGTGVPNSEDVGSDLADFIVDDDDEAEDEEDIVKLAPGNSMYVDPSSPTNVRVKRPAPLTPPLSTRGARSRDQVSDLGSPHVSPTKKRRFVAPDVNDEPVAPSTPARKSVAKFPSAAVLFDDVADAPAAPVTPSKRASPSKKNTPAVAKSKAKMKTTAVAPANDDALSSLSDLSDSSPEVVVPRSSKKAAMSNQTSVKKPATHVKNTVKAKQETTTLVRSVACKTDMAPAERPRGKPSVQVDEELEDASGSYHDDKYMFYVKTMPSVCEVDNVNFHDRKLKAKGFYNKLPLLKRVDIIPLRDSTTQGPVRFSSWPTILPNAGLKISMIEQALTFVCSGRYINASRISPDELSGRPVNGANTRFEICTGGRATAILVSPCLVHASHLQSFHPMLKYSGHYFTGLLHVLELDRLISAMGMVFDQGALQMQIWSDALTFGTLTQGAGGKKEDDIALSGAFDANASPTKARVVNHDSVAIEPIPYEGKIPVYDARKQEFSLDKDTLRDLGAHFDLFEDEITRNSCVIVGYIAQLQKGDTWRLHLYAKWIILLGLQDPPTK